MYKSGNAKEFYEKNKYINQQPDRKQPPKLWYYSCSFLFKDRSPGSKSTAALLTLHWHCPVREQKCNDNVAAYIAQPPACLHPGLYFVVVCEADLEVLMLLVSLLVS